MKLVAKVGNILWNWWQKLVKSYEIGGKWLYKSFLEYYEYDLKPACILGKNRKSSFDP